MAGCAVDAVLGGGVAGEGVADFEFDVDGDHAAGCAAGCFGLGADRDLAEAVFELVDAGAHAVTKVSHVAIPTRGRRRGRGSCRRSWSCDSSEQVALREPGCDEFAVPLLNLDPDRPAALRSGGQEGGP